MATMSKIRYLVVLYIPAIRQLVAKLVESMNMRTELIKRNLIFSLILNLFTQTKHIFRFAINLY